MNILITNDDGTLKFVYDKELSSRLNSNQKRYLVNKMLGMEKYFSIKNMFKMMHNVHTIFHMHCSWDIYNKYNLKKK